MPGPFEHATCSAPADRAGRMRDAVLEYTNGASPLRILDVGCGAGVLALDLANALPRASVLGIDVSPASIKAARARASADRAADRVRFETADYLQFDAPRADVIVTDTALHFFRGSPDRLWTKLAADLRDDGVLVCSMAYDCAHNRMLRAARRGMRAVRSRALDNVLLAIARTTFGQSMNDDLLRERIEYMYIPPEQFMTDSLATRLIPSVGLRTISMAKLPTRSATQLKQQLTVFRKIQPPLHGSRSRS